MALEFKDLMKFKWYTLVLGAFVICGAFLGLFWYEWLAPIQAEIDVKTMKLDDLQKTIAKSLVQQRQLAKLKQDALELQAKLAMLTAVLPTEKETDQIFRAVQQQATSSGLQVRRVAPKATIDHDAYTEYPIDLEVIGTYHNVGAFLDKIRQLPRIVNINGLKLTSLASEGDKAFTSSVGATYTATTFVYKDEPIASAAPPSQPVK